ncbi:unnamed protein product [Caenorhabditis auriculariae]|uniref:Uncharacterized protein n=1 Tax=Caenorhabditis auriculariae TaxID=2777116 RepID=A0A8S1HMQ5_9PELO|nr:unnamed protein product [Caenorhabditis auriculariae]
MKRSLPPCIRGDVLKQNPWRTKFQLQARQYQAEEPVLAEACLGLRDAIKVVTRNASSLRYSRFTASLGRKKEWQVCDLQQPATVSFLIVAGPIFRWPKPAVN